eukprot:COSAG02_NODE_4556_length_5219_cov_3.546094_3_plen_65_part_00
MSVELLAGLGDGIALAAQPEPLIHPQPASTPKRSTGDSTKAPMHNMADRAAPSASASAEVPPDV